MFDIHILKKNLLVSHHDTTTTKIQIVFAGYYDIPESDMPETDIPPKSIFLSLEGGDRGTCSNCGRSYKNEKEFKRHLYRKRCHVHGMMKQLSTSNGAGAFGGGAAVDPSPMPMGEISDAGVGILAQPALPGILTAPALRTSSPESYLKMEPPSPEIILRE